MNLESSLSYNDGDIIGRFSTGPVSVESPKKGVIWINKELLKRRLLAKIGYSPLNFDADTIFTSLRLARNLERKYNNILMRKSSSGRGWHFKVMDGKTTRFLPSLETVEIRDDLGDDYGRLKCDRIRLLMGLDIGILADYKNGKYAGEWERLDFTKIFSDLIIVNVE